MRSILLCGAASVMMLPAFPLFAQEEPEFPDSLLFGAPVEVSHVRTLDSVGTVMAELQEVQAKLVVLKDDWYGGVYALAVLSSGGFDLYPILGNQRVNDVQLSTTDVRGNGKLQVVVRTMSYAGHTDWEHAIHEREWVVQLWDLQERRCLLHLVSGHSHEEWTNTFAPDSTGLLPYEKRTMLSSEGEVTCEMHNVSFGPREMTLVRTDDCPDLHDHEAMPAEERSAIRYALGKDAWVKQ